MTAADSAAAQFPIVGLGGSAGSITSFREFFRNVEPDSGMAYVVILHLSPEHESRLAEVLQGSAKIPVTQVQGTVKIEPNCVYVIPPNKSMSLSDGHLVLSEVKGFEERRAPVDIFFRTLGDHLDSRAIAIVMSGTGADGSMGIRRVKETNGLVLVQDPAEAEFGEMPRNAIATGVTDFVVPVAEMPRRIASYRRQVGALRLAERVEEHREDDEQALVDVFTLLRVRTGQDFANYKRATVLRRIERRLAVHDLKTLTEYAKYMRENQDEPQALLRELLISVTNFFRDADVWETVEKAVIPKLLEGKRADDHLRIWVAGCATGEEAFSLAMLLAERPGLPDVQIFATDLDEHAIARARNACYSEADVADVAPERLRRFFIHDSEGFRIRREVREMVLFAHHNLIKDPPFSHLDFISCRNLLIYLNRTAQQRALEVMHFALEPGGYLLLGTAESADAASGLFSLADKDAHLFQSRAVPRVVNPPQAPQGGPVEVRVARPASEPRQFEGRVRERFAPLDLHHRLLETYAPPSLIVDEDYNIVHLSERVGRYLQFAGGEASTNVLQVIRPNCASNFAARCSRRRRRRRTSSRAASWSTREIARSTSISW